MPKQRKHKLRRTTVFLTEEQQQRLSATSAATDIPVARLIRRGIELVLTQYERTLNNLLAARSELRTQRRKASDG